jgi:hypothetical protein
MRGTRGSAAGRRRDQPEPRHPLALVVFLPSTSSVNRPIEQTVNSPFVGVLETPVSG